MPLSLSRIDRGDRLCHNYPSLLVVIVLLTIIISSSCWYTYSPISSAGLSIKGFLLWRVAEVKCIWYSFYPGVRSTIYPSCQTKTGTFWGARIQSRGVLRSNTSNRAFVTLILVTATILNIPVVAVSCAAFNQVISAIPSTRNSSTVRINTTASSINSFGSWKEKNQNKKIFHLSTKIDVTESLKSTKSLKNRYQFCWSIRLPVGQSFFTNMNHLNHVTWWISVVTSM